MKWWPRLRAAQALIERLEEDRRIFGERFAAALDEIEKLRAKVALAQNDADAAEQHYLDEIDALPERFMAFLDASEHASDADRETRNDAYRRLFGSPDGQIILRDLAKACHVLTPTLATGQAGMDAGLTGFQEGQRWAFQRIWRLSNSAPSAGGKSE